MRIAIAQINSTVGDLSGNFGKIAEYTEKAKLLEADLVVFPELALTGYPPEDLLLKAGFIRDNITKLNELAKTVSGISAVVGFVDRSGPNIYNAAAHIEGKKVKYVYHKTFLPNYGVFDEKRYFDPGAEKPRTFRIKGVPAGINICEDIWFEDGPAKSLSKSGAKIILVINASPYSIAKVRTREKIIRKQAVGNKVFIVYVNLVGGQDGIVFDGFSMVVNPQGKIIARAEGFAEELLMIDLPLGPEEQKPVVIYNNSGALGAEEEVYKALMTGLRDYVLKNSFKNVVIGLSGGIDSAIVAALAADCLGRENVHAVFMPSKFSSYESREDAERLARNLGIDFLTIPIEGPMEAYAKLMTPFFKGLKPDVTEENLQARIRGNILMALSNKFGWLVLTTGNKSEMSTGYATLYGDMAGGFAVIKDVPKTLVYGISKYRNSLSPVIPERIITKAPTAELRPNQKDSDSLPVYDILDPILKAYIEDDKDLEYIISRGFDRDTVKKVLRLVDGSEYKRRQSPPGVKITPKAFGKDRRMPITNKYGK